MFLFGRGGFWDTKKRWILRVNKYEENSRNHCSSKVLLPYEIFKFLIETDVAPPYLFKIQDMREKHSTVCSVLDFALEDDDIFMPSWMFEHLSLKEGCFVSIEHTEVEMGTGVKLRPECSEFFDKVENYRLELERALAEYLVLTRGDTIHLTFADMEECRFTVTEVYPEGNNSIYLADVDLKVEFEEPEDYNDIIKESKTVRKYIEIDSVKDGVQKMRMKRLGLFLDWDNLRKVDDKDDVRDSTK